MGRTRTPKNSKIYPPQFTTVCVCSEFPEAMLVSAQAASSCSDGLMKDKEEEGNRKLLPLPKKAKLVHSLVLLQAVDENGSQAGTGWWEINRHDNTRGNAVSHSNAIRWAHFISKSIGGCRPFDNIFLKGVKLEETLLTTSSRSNTRKLLLPTPPDSLDRPETFLVDPALCLHHQLLKTMRAYLLHTRKGQRNREERRER